MHCRTQRFQVTANCIVFALRSIQNLERTMGSSHDKEYSQGMKACPFDTILYCEYGVVFGIFPAPLHVHESQSV